MWHVKLHRSKTMKTITILFYVLLFFFFLVVGPVKNLAEQEKNWTTGLTIKKNIIEYWVYFNKIWCHELIWWFPFEGCPHNSQGSLTYVLCSVVWKCHCAPLTLHGFWLQSDETFFTKATLINFSIQSLQIDVPANKRL